MQCIFVIPMCIGFAISALVGAAIGQGDTIPQESNDWGNQKIG